MKHRDILDDVISSNYGPDAALADKIKKNLYDIQNTVPERHAVNIKNNHVIERYTRNPRAGSVKGNENPQSEKNSVNPELPSRAGKPAPLPRRLSPEPEPDEVTNNTFSSRAEKEMMWLDDPQTLYLRKKLHVSDSLNFVSNLALVLSSSCVLDALKKVRMMADLIATADTVQYPVFAIDRAGRVIAWNKAMERITSLTGQEMIGKGDYAYAIPFYGTARPMLIDRIIAPPPRAKNGTWHSVSGIKEVFTSDTEKVWIRGKPKLIWGRGIRICDEEGTVIAAVQSLGIRDPLPPETPEPGRGITRSGSGGTSSAPPGSFVPGSAIPDWGMPGFPAGDRAGSGLGTTARVSYDGESPDEYEQQKHEDLHNAFGLLVATEDNVLRNYEELSEDPRRLIESERDARTSEEFLRHVILDAREGIIAYDCDLRCILWNTFMENLTGILREEVLGQRAFDMFPALKDAGAYVLLEQALSGETVESSDISFHIQRSGKQAWVRLIFSTLCDSKGHIMGIIGIVQDTTARKVMEYALQTTIIQLMENEEKYRNVFNAKNDPLLLVDTGSRSIIDLNNAALDLYGYTREEILATALVDLFIEPEKFEELVESQIPAIHMYQQRKKDGTTFPADISSAFFDLKGRSVLILSIRDLSSVYQIADALRLANTKLNLLIGVTRHDVINNLTVLMGYNDLLKHNLTDAGMLAMLEKQESALHTIHRQIEFTREYYDLGVKSPLWQNVCDTATRAYSQFINIVSFTCDTDDLEIYADPLLEKVFYNLFDNAFRYGEGISSIRIYCIREATDLLLIFGDDGQGIPPENKERIFTRGFGKNTGLGLFLSREILAITRIEITETGEFEKGARFEFRIPEGSYRFPGSGKSIRAPGSEKMNLPA